MVKIALLLLLGIAALGAVEHRFAPGEVRAYSYALQQTVTWESADDAGDKALTYTTELRWTVLIRALTDSEESAVPRSLPADTAAGLDAQPLLRLRATMLSVLGQHQGPGALHQIDSGAPRERDRGADDPLLGHLLLQTGVSLDLAVLASTGEVVAVSGQQAILDKLDRAKPGHIPGEPGPLHKAAKAAFTEAALIRWWGTILALPQPGTDVAIPANGALPAGVMRRWGDDGSYYLRLAEGVTSLPVVLHPAPTAVTGVLSPAPGKDHLGSGAVSIQDGVLLGHRGDLEWVLQLDALTQGVTQHHRIVWSIEMTKQTPPER